MWMHDTGYKEVKENVKNGTTVVSEHAPESDVYHDTPGAKSAWDAANEQQKLRAIHNATSRAKTASNGSSPVSKGISTGDKALIIIAALAIIFLCCVVALAMYGTGGSSL